MNLLKNLGMEVLMKKYDDLYMISCSFPSLCDTRKNSRLLVVNKTRLTVKTAKNHQKDGPEVSPR